jgi:hypothetical protein
MLKIKSLIIITIFASCTDEDKMFTLRDNNMSSTINIGSKLKYQSVDKITKDDIIVFNLPQGSQKTCLRVVGIPGDTINILKGKLLINEIQYEHVNSSNMIYTVYSKAATDFTNLKQYNFKPYSENYGMVCITKKQFNEIAKRKLVDSIYSLGFDSAYVYPDIVRTKKSKYFNHYYFGPLIIPKVGDTIFKDDKMLVQSFIKFNEQIIVNDEYYFCIGDNFSDAIDSRVIGLVPKSKILGKVIDIRNVKIISIENK